MIAAFIVVNNALAGRRVLFVAHRRELIDQCYGCCWPAGFRRLPSGVLMARDPRRCPGAAVQIASIDTLRNRVKPAADLVTVDEAHRALARSYRDLAAAYPDVTRTQRAGGHGVLVGPTKREPAVL